MFLLAVVWEFAAEELIEEFFAIPPETSYFRNRWEEIILVGFFAATLLIVLTLLLRQHVRPQEALRLSEERLRGAIESLQEGFALFDAADRLVALNEEYRRVSPAAQEIMERGGTFEDVIRANIARGVIVEAQGREDAFLAERMAQHRDPKGPLIRRFTDGSWHMIEEVRTPEGGIALSFIDITDLKKGEEDIRRLAEAIEGLSENFALYDPDDRLIMCNKGYREINEAIPEATTPGTLFEDHLRAMGEKGLAPEAVGRQEEWLRERMERHRNPKGPFELRRQDGIWLLIHDQRMPDGSTATISTDITERKQTEEVLRETETIRRSEERLRTIFETSPIGIAIVSPETNKRLYINPAMVELFGAESVEQLLEHDLGTTYADPEELKRLRARTGDDFITEIEVERVRLDGSRWWCLLSRRLIDYEGKEALIGWHYDITERRQVEEEIKRLNDELEHRVEERTKELQESEEKHRHFSADVAHELRTPLAVLRSHLDNLENTETIQSLIKDIDAMSRLVSQLLATTRLDSLTVNPNDEADLHSIGAEVTKYLAPFAIKEGRSIEMTGTQDPVIVRGNDDALEMAVRNLVENAIRYSARETVVTIHVSDEPAISVINHGRGIPPEQQKVIFRRFKRADRRSGGAGLGLSIVQRVVEAHQAAIDVSDAPGGGTVFKISFPSDQSRKVAEV